MHQRKSAKALLRYRIYRWKSEKITIYSLILFMKLTAQNTIPMITAKFTVSIVILYLIILMSLTVINMKRMTLGEKYLLKVNFKSRIMKAEEI